MCKGAPKSDGEVPWWAYRTHLTAALAHRQRTTGGDPQTPLMGVVEQEQEFRYARVSGHTDCRAPSLDLDPSLRTTAPLERREQR